MKAIKLNCKTGGFNFGATVEVGDNKNQIDAETAKGLVKDHLAVEVKEVVASAGDSDKVITALEGKVETLTEANTELEGKVETLTEANGILADEKTALEAKANEPTDGSDEALKARITELEGYVEVAIGLNKGKIPNGYKKA